MNRSLLAVLVSVVLGSTALCAQSTSKLPSSEAGDFLGTWALAMEIQGNPVEMQLVISDEGGNTAAKLTSELTPAGTEIEDIRLSGNALLLTWPRDFQGQEMILNMQLEHSETGLSGSFGDTNGMFSADVTGNKGSAATTEAPAATRPASRRRFGPTVAKITIAGKEVRVNHDPVPAEDDLLEHLSMLATGEVAHWKMGRAIKILTDQSLDFGGAVLEYGNAVPSYPGVYSVWPKKTASGWSLVFNQDADIWGTMREAAADVSEVPVKYRTLTEPAPKLAVQLEETATGGTLSIQWGPHEWTAAFALKP